MRFLIKACGITTTETAAYVSRLGGAHAVGVNFCPSSPRFIGGVEEARRVLASVDPRVLKIGVFVDASVGKVESTMIRAGLDMAQLHGSEDPADFTQFPPSRLIRAVRVRDVSSFADDGRWNASLRIYDGLGNGSPPPWDLIAKHGTRPFLLAGGLTAENVVQAVATTNPDGVDVCSGIETTPGKFFSGRFDAFARAARDAHRAGAVAAQARSLAALVPQYDPDAPDWLRELIADINCAHGRPNGSYCPNCVAERLAGMGIDWDPTTWPEKARSFSSAEIEANARSANLRLRVARLRREVGAESFDDAVEAVKNFDGGIK